VRAFRVCASVPLCVRPMFEATAGIICPFLQHSPTHTYLLQIMTGKEEYIDPRTPLLGSATTEQQQQEEAEEEVTMQLARAATERFVTFPDPFSSLPLLGGGGAWL